MNDKTFQDKTFKLNMVGKLLEENGQRCSTHINSTIYDLRCLFSGLPASRNCEIELCISTLYAN